ncbi:MAG: DUF3108 domain-containing protein [Gallionella sp.]|nr:DUF3108 domain-containing protein [Gallionella sp.]
MPPCPAALKLPAVRIGIAIGLSLMAHFVVLVSPVFKFPVAESPLPPLIAKLEPLPKVAAPAPKKPKPEKPHGTPKKVSELPTTQEASTEETPVAEPQVAQDEPVAITKSEPAPPLPKHAQLTFSAYQGTGGMQIGESIHRLDIADGQYTLTAITQTTGLASIFKSYLLTQTSRGRTGEQGLHPDSFDEEKKQSKGTQNVRAEFDRTEHKLHFSHGGEADLPEQAQDILSFLYQLSQLSMNTTPLPLFISNGKKLESYQMDIGAEEEISTPLGKLRALPLRKLHAKGEEGFDVWLGLEYRLLPVKIRQIDRAGQIAGEMVISDIRLTDE